jgi:2-isopropylmalate synthase
MRIYTFDTTLRDGTQGEAISYSVEDKLIIAQKLDEFGIDYIEGGWPGSNPKDKEFFERAKSLKLHHAKLTAFGATRFAKHTVMTDPSVQELAHAGTPCVTIFGKTWDFHVTRALGIPLEDNFKLISETVGYIKSLGKEVVYDAEHFFDGYKANPDYALRTLEAAKNAGADVLCLCDTNGGSLPEWLAGAVRVVVERFGGVVGIHPHNDSDVAVANALAAIEAGATHVQGCMNGYGERTGNVNLASVIANLELKMGHETVGREKLGSITSVCRFIAELANLPLRNDQPYVGQSAFAHKGGIHVSAVLKDSATYEHISPALVGNHQRVLISDMSGRSNVVYKLEQHGLAGKLTDEAKRHLLERIKQMEYEGYELEAAEGTFELLVREAMTPNVNFFDVVNFEVTTKMAGSKPSQTEATVNIKARDGVHSATAEGHGPVHALDVCLRQCLSTLYPGISNVRLTDYKVRVLDTKKGTAAKVRVLVEWSDHQRSWATVGVSDNVIEASWLALLDAIRLELMRLTDQDQSIEKAVEDYCWGV